MQIKCPCCGEAFAIVVMAAPKHEAFGARTSKHLAEKLDQAILAAIAKRPGKLRATGRSGVWENKSRLPEELHSVGRDTMQKAVARLLMAGLVEKLSDGTLRAKT